MMKRILKKRTFAKTNASGNLTISNAPSRTAQINIIGYKDGTIDDFDYYKDEGLYKTLVKCTRKFYKNNSFNNPDYQELEYISSSGTQFITTNINFTSNNARLKTKLVPIVTSSYPTYRAGGAYGSGLRSFVLYSAGPTHYLGMGSNDLNTQIACSANLIYEIDYKTKNNVVEACINNQSFSMTYSGTIVNGQKYNIFRNSDGYNGHYKIYYLQLWQDDVLIGNFIPCYRISDNVAGMFDTIGNAFYVNNGSGTFGIGAKVVYEGSEDDYHFFNDYYESYCLKN